MPFDDPAPRAVSQENQVPEGPAARSVASGTWAATLLVAGGLAVGTVSSYVQTTTRLEAISFQLERHLDEVKVAKEKRDAVQNDQDRHLVRLDGQFAQILEQLADVKATVHELKTSVDDLRDEGSSDQADRQQQHQHHN